MLNASWMNKWFFFSFVFHKQEVLLLLSLKIFPFENPVCKHIHPHTHVILRHVCVCDRLSLFYYVCLDRRKVKPCFWQHVVYKFSPFCWDINCTVKTPLNRLDEIRCKLMWGPYSTVQHKLARSVLSPTPLPSHYTTCRKLQQGRVSTWPSDVSWHCMTHAWLSCTRTCYLLYSCLIYILLTRHNHIYIFCTTSGWWTYRVVSRRIHKKLCSFFIFACYFSVFYLYL